MAQKYELVVGLEVHARIKTKSKLWCSCDAYGFGKNPNENTCEVCMGFPGALPVLNEDAVNLALKTGKALNCDIPNFSKFDRKSYFYPDLPTGFQTTQFDEPVCKKGFLEVYVENREGKKEKKKFGIDRIHIENDAGKLSHTSNGTEVDLNRAGCPLMEIVTEPDFRSIADVKAFLQEMQKVLRAAGSSDADMEKGQLRADVNISLRPFGQKEFGIRAELKNMNSFSEIEKALKYEYKRQAILLDSGKEVVQETRGWDAVKGESTGQRGKGGAADYRYFPEPDLPTILLSDEKIASVKKCDLPTEKYEKYQSEFGIKEIDAFILSSDVELSQFFEETAKISGDSKKSASWILSEFIKFLKEDLIKISESKVKPEHIGNLIKFINNGEISGKIGKEVFEEVYKTGKNPEDIIEEKGLKQNSNEDELREICQKILDDNSDLVEKYHGGRDNLFGSFVGQTMKATQGKANPGIVNKILKELLSK
ncbi:Asp-tRNA(Asn)/Glu-tRNA(Gln) amidotransferase subunit GatB [Candidatus Gracilibacteria bacterium]|nr:Asp-tRNA(Asn)/Glu-tRNA(Gln) amidotransferase subunit GatB [Candidatus Gracilibacteria bacterium]